MIANDTCRHLLMVIHIQKRLLQSFLKSCRSETFGKTLRDTLEVKVSLSKFAGAIAITL